MLKYQQITDDILKRIEEGVLKPNDRIPSAREMKELYSVSQITALRVFKELLADGKVVRRNGSGYFVRSEADERDNVSGILFCVMRPPKPINPDDNFGTRLMCGIIDAASLHHRPLMFSKVRLNWDEFGHVLDELADAVAEEIAALEIKPSAILLDLYFSDEQIKNKLLPAAGKIPLVVAGRHSSLPVITVAPDMAAIGQELAGIAYQSRAEQFLMFPIRSMPDCALLCDTFRNQLLEKGIPADEFISMEGCMQTRKREQEIWDEVENRIRHSGKRICLLSPHDYFAKSVQKEFAARNIEFGRDASLLSCGHIEMLDRTYPRITTMDLQPEQIGAAAAGAVINLGINPQWEIHTRHTLLLNETWSIF